MTAGPLTVYLEGGVIIGLSSDPSLNSVIVWDEAKRDVSEVNNSLKRGDELFAITESEKFLLILEANCRLPRNWDDNAQVQAHECEGTPML